MNIFFGIPFSTVIAMKILFFPTTTAYGTIILALNKIIFVGILPATFTGFHKGKVHCGY
jgi:hypothetical protein